MLHHAELALTEPCLVPDVLVTGCLLPDDLGGAWRLTYYVEHPHAGERLVVARLVFPGDSLVRAALTVRSQVPALRMLG